MDLDTLRMNSIGHSLGVGIRHLWTHWGCFVKQGAGTDLGRLYYKARGNGRKKDECIHLLYTPFSTISWPSSNIIYVTGEASGNRARLVLSIYQYCPTIEDPSCVLQTV